VADEKVAVRSEFCYSKHVEQRTKIMYSYPQEVKEYIFFLNWGNRNKS